MEMAGTRSGPDMPGSRQNLPTRAERVMALRVTPLRDDLAARLVMADVG
jgi:hypothetical protein